MSAISQKSISGITSITTPAGVDNVFTVHTNDTTERFRVDSNGNQVIAGILTASNHVFITGGDLVINDVISHFGDGNSKIRFPADDTFTVETSGNERLRITSGGDLLVGRTTGLTDAKVSIQCDTDESGIAVQLNTSTGTSNLLQAYSAAGPNVASITVNPDATPDLMFNVWDGSSTAERLRIKSDGSVGIGTNNPTEDLHIGSNSPYILLDDYDNARKWRIKGTAWFAIEDATAGVDRLRITSSGQIGIGTATIRNNRAMQITGESNSLVLITGHAPSICLNRDPDDSSDGDRSFFGVSSVSNGFANGTAAGDTIIRGNSSGKIHLATSTSIRLSIASGGDTTFYGSNVSLAVGTLYIPDSLVHNGDNDTKIRFPSNDTITFETASSERLRITSTGRLGLNMASPQRRVHIHTTGSGSDYIQFTNDTTGTTSTSGYVFGISSEEDVIHNNFESTNMRFYTAGSERLRITSDGKIGINDTDPDAKLEIRDSAATGVIIRCTNTQTTDSNKAIRVRNNSDTDTFYVSHKGKGYFAGDVTVSGDLFVSSSLAKIQMTDTDGGDYFQLRNDGGTFKIRNSSDGRDDISITNNNLTVGGVLTITDNNSIFFGGSSDIEMRHNATSSQNQIIGKNHNFLLQSYGTIYMQCFQSGNSTNGNVLTANYNSGTALYYQNGERLVTTNAGCKVSNSLSFNNWLNISKDGTYAPASVGHTAANNEGIFWHSAVQYSIYRNSGTWGGPNYQQLNLNWPTGIRFDGGYQYGVSGARFNCHALPTNNDNFDLGTSALRWRDVYCNQGAFNNSDEVLKQDIASLTTAEMKAAKRLSALFKTYRWKDAVDKKGTDKARTHTGMIAQQIQAAMSAEGLDATKYGLFGIDEWYENDKKEIITLDQLKDDIPDPLDSSKTVTPPSIEGYTKVTRYSVRYTELLSFIAAYNDQRFADLESRVAALEGS